MGVQESKLRYLNSDYSPAKIEDESISDYSSGNYKANIYIGQTDVDKMKDNSCYFKPPVPAPRTKSAAKTAAAKAGEKSSPASDINDSWRQELKWPDSGRRIQIVSKNTSKFYTKEDIAHLDENLPLSARKDFLKGIRPNHKVILTEVDGEVRQGDCVLVSVRPKPGMPKYPLVVRPVCSPPEDVVESLKKFDWYLGDITRDEAIYLLKDAKPGTYMVRNSTTFPGWFVLSVKIAHEKRIRNYIIEMTKDGYRIWGKNTFPTINKMIEAIKSGLLLPSFSLLYPCLKDETALHKLYQQLNQTWWQNFIATYAQ